MTLSKQERLDDITRALQMILDQLSDQPIDAVYVDIREAPFRDIYPTTWKELADRHYTKRLDVIGAEQYRLTGNGWFRALELTGRLQDLVMMEKLTKFAAALKNSIEGRQQPGLVSVASLATECGVSEGWVFNAIEADLVGRHFNVHGASWATHTMRGTFIDVPIDFGMRHLLDE